MCDGDGSPVSPESLVAGSAANSGSSLREAFQRAADMSESASAWRKQFAHLLALKERWTTRGSTTSGKFAVSEHDIVEMKNKLGLEFRKFQKDATAHDVSWCVEPCYALDQCLHTAAVVDQLCVWRSRVLSSDHWIAVEHHQLRTAHRRSMRMLAEAGHDDGYLSCLSFSAQALRP